MWLHAGKTNSMLGLWLNKQYRRLFTKYKLRVPSAPYSLTGNQKYIGHKNTVVHAVNVICLTFPLLIMLCVKVHQRSQESKEASLSY